MSIKAECLWLALNKSTKEKKEEALKYINDCQEEVLVKHGYEHRSRINRI